mmetsp:Transcript_14418/g.28459  ORF Transcript_14418/g.28459 Transcript_14418/m.28459 type:complete len:486 (-) Transcript_14418:97-1554(-)
MAHLHQAEEEEEAEDEEENEVEEEDLAIEESDAQRWYDEARACGVGTVTTLELPECTVSVVNLVDIARFMKCAAHSSVEQQCVDDVGRCLAEDGEEENGGCDCEAEEDSPAWNSNSKSHKETDSEIHSCRDRLEEAKPVVYSGTFKDYKRDSMRFTRFSTISAFSKALVRGSAQLQGADSSSACTTTAATVAKAQALSADHVHATNSGGPMQIIDCPASMAPGYCQQLLGLAAPPGAAPNKSMYVAIPAAAVGGTLAAVASTTVASRVKATTNRVVPDCKSRLSRHQSTDKVGTAGGRRHPSSSREPRSKAAAAAAARPRSGSEGPAAARTSQQQEVTGIRSGNASCIRPSIETELGATVAAASTSRKKAAVLGGRKKDDGSSWIIDGPRCLADVRPLGLQPRRASSWGARTPSVEAAAADWPWTGGNVPLQPLVRGKIPLNSTLKVALPKLPGGPIQHGAFEHPGQLSRPRLGLLPKPGMLLAS